MKFKSWSTIALLSIASMACEERTEPAEPSAAETSRPIEPAPDEPAGPPAISAASKATYQMSLWADAPNSLDPGPDTVVLKYDQYPGYYERFDAALVKDCVLAYEKKPFTMTVYRYEFADKDSYERIVAIEACPQVDEKKLAAQWREAEMLREGQQQPDSPDPEKNMLGWAGRGFYKVDGADEGNSPSGEEWQTFCGETTGVDCDTALRTGTGDR